MGRERGGHTWVHSTSVLIERLGEELIVRLDFGRSGTASFPMDLDSAEKMARAALKCVESCRRSAARRKGK